MEKIIVKGKEYFVKFDYFAIRKFSKIVGINKPSEIEKFFNSMDFEDPGFDDIDNIVHLIISAVKSDEIPTFDDTLEEFSTTPGNIMGALNSFSESTTIDISEEEKK